MYYVTITRANEYANSDCIIVDDKEIETIHEVYDFIMPYDTESFDISITEVPNT